MLCMFQVFCSHLELLVQQLYTISEKMELLAAPTVDIDSVKSSLAEYQVRAEPQGPVILHTGFSSGFAERNFAHFRLPATLSLLGLKIQLF